MPLRLALALFLAVAGSCAASQPLPSVPLPPELDTVLRDYERAWVAKTPQALSRLFTGSGIALPNGQTPARGADAIRRAYAQCRPASNACKAIPSAVPIRVPGSLLRLESGVYPATSFLPASGRSGLAVSRKEGKS